MNYNQRYEEAVNKVARRMLPALSRSFFSSTLNAEDVAAAEVRSLLERAWLSRISDLFEDPCKGDLELDLAAASGASASSAGGEVRRNPDCGTDGLRVRPLHVAKDLLKMHVLACRVSEGEDMEVGPTSWGTGLCGKTSVEVTPDEYTPACCADTSSSVFTFRADLGPKGCGGGGIAPRLLLLRNCKEIRW